MLDGNVLLRQKRDEVPEGTLSCPDRNLAVFHHYRHYEGLRLLPSVCDSKLIQQTLYKDNDLKKLDEKNRRLYITSEFNENGRLISDRNVGVRNADSIKKNLSQSNEKIKDNDVFDLDGNSLALSKENFAQNVLEKTVPFDNMDFSAFYPVFARLKEILERPES